MRRLLVLMSGVALTGIVIAILVPTRVFARMNAAERAAARSMLSIAEAQRSFRESVGRRGYATDLASLLTSCSSELRAPLKREDLAVDYVVLVRASGTATLTGTDCHGRPIASDYYAAAEPANELAGRQAFAMTARARVYVFFDGLAPLEADLGPGGLAVRLDTLDSFKIP